MTDDRESEGATILSLDVPRVLPEERPSGAPVVLLPHVEVDPHAEPELPIEPRLRARRIEVRQAARRRRRRIVWSVVAVLVLIGAGIGAVASPLLAVDEIDVRGAHHVGDRAVVAASGLHRGDRLLTVDIDRVVTRVARLPWVRSVRVERELPGTLRIRVTERAPVATVAGSDGSQLVVTAGGWVAGRATGFDGGLPLVVLPVDRVRVGMRLPKPIAAATEMAGALPSSILARAASATVSETGELTVQLRPQGEVLFGEPQDVEGKFRAAETLLSDAVVQDCLQRVDVRIPSAEVISRSC